MKRILLSVMTIALVSAATFGATRAYFSSEAVSGGNTLSAGTLELTLGSPVNGFLTMSNMAPGDSVTGSIDVENTGSLNADHLAITFDNIVSDENGDANPDMDSQLIVKSMKLGPYPITNDLVTYMDGSKNGVHLGYGYYIKLKDGNVNTDIDVNKDGKISLAELKGKTIFIHGGNPANFLKAGGKGTLTVTVEFDKDAGNEYQGDTVESILTFTLNQVRNQ